MPEFSNRPPDPVEAVAPESTGGDAPKEQTPPDRTEELERVKEAQSASATEQAEQAAQALPLLFANDTGEVDQMATDCVAWLQGQGFETEEIEAISAFGFVSEALAELRDFEEPFEEFSATDVAEVKNQLALSQKEKTADVKEGVIEDKEKAVVDENKAQEEREEAVAEENQVQEENEKETDILKAYTERAKELQAEKLDNTVIVERLLEKFSEQGKDSPDLKIELDNLRRFQAALELPEELRGEEEALRGVFDGVDIDFSDTDASLGSFADAVAADALLPIEEQKLSEAAREHVCKKLGRTVVRTGTDIEDLMDETLLVDDGQGGQKEIPRYTERNPAKIQGGMEMYVDEATGKRYIRNPYHAEQPVEIKADGIDAKNDFKDRVNLSLIRHLLGEEFNGEPAILLGGEVLDTDSETYPEAIKRANAIIHAFIPREIENRVLNHEEMWRIQMGLRAITRQKSQTVEEWAGDMEGLGILDESGGLNPNVLNDIGIHLEAKGYLDSKQDQFKDDNAYDALLEFVREKGHIPEEPEESSV